MAPPKRSILDRIRDKIDDQSDQPGEHHIWTGAMHQNHPHLRNVGNLVRVLLNINTPHIQVRPECLEPRCVNPNHWRVIRETSRKYSGAKLAPPWTDPRIRPDGLSLDEQEKLDLELQEIEAGNQTLDDTLEFYANQPLHHAYLKEHAR